MDQHADRPTQAEIRELHRIPLYSVNGYRLDGDSLAFSGLALAPDGKGELVSFSAGEGIAFAVEYPLPNPAAKHIYWYWPESDHSAFRVTVKLPETKHNDKYYTFNVNFRGFENNPLEHLRTGIILPKDVGILHNFPSQERLERVQRFDTVNSVAVSGLNAAWRMTEIAKYYGWDAEGAVLDWGVGHGRVARHIAKFSNATVFGIDIDPDNISWIQENLSDIVEAVVGPLLPPTEYQTDSFSMLYGLSVMTHLPLDVQRAWLIEIERVLKPGGLALLTFAGDGAVAFSSVHLDRAWMDEYHETGRGPALPDRSLVGVIDNPEYYQNIKQTAARAAELCQEYMDVVAVHECMFGYQDLLVLRKRS